jgi:hypothetical protein
MLATTEYDQHVSARLLDFFSDRTAWQRTLWSSGTILNLRELLEASDAVANGVVSQSSLGNYAHSIDITIGRDFGVGDDQRRRQLCALLKMDDRSRTLAAAGLQYRSIEMIIPEISNEYLKRWAAALSPASKPVRAERSARAIAAHLLDCGLHPEFLHRWWTFKSKHEPGSKNLSELLNEANMVVSAPERDFEALLIFEKAVPIDARRPQPKQWLTNKEVSGWLHSNGFPVSGLRQKGGYLIQIKARDTRTVIDAVAEAEARLISRINLGTPSFNGLATFGRVWIKGEQEPFDIPHPRRRVEVHSLQRENQLYNLHNFGTIDAAIELIEPLDAQPPSAAVAGGWAAIEALLTGPGDRDQRVQAGDRLAAITACSFPRAELTTLSYELERQRGQLGVELKACTTNKERCEIVLREINAKTPFTFKRSSDAAAWARLVALVDNPGRVLRDIEARLSECFRRLYRNRNIVLHGGKTDAVGLRACLRLTAPLVGAGLDRIAHAAYTEKLSPLELAARARIRLDALDSAAAVRPIDLLS